MKSLIRSFVINIAAIHITTSIMPGFTNSGGFKTLALAVVVLGIINLLIKPLISLLLLPINILTLGAFRWLINVAVLFLLTQIIPQLSVSAFRFPGLSYQGFVVPEVQISIFWSLVISSITISFTNAFLFWLSWEK